MLQKLRYHESRYNYEFSALAGKQYICNGISGSIIEKPSVPISSTNFSSDTREFLIQNHFLIENSVDELDLVLKRNKLISESRESLELTIMLHEDCNFRCTYCFHEFKNQQLEKQTQKKILDFINKRLSEKGVLNLHFYGGEPLLAWDSLVFLNEKAMNISHKKDSKYNFCVTTNGSLLSSEKCLYFSSQNISHAKISIDGPPEIHDARRIQTNGKGTFNTILRNIRHAIQFFNVIIRVNLDSTNTPHIYLLFWIY